MTDLRIDKESDAWKWCLQSVVDLLGGCERRSGRQTHNVPYRTLEHATGLKDFIASTLEARALGATWSDQDSWNAVESVLLDVEDDDYSQPELLTAKILLGYYETPDFNAVIPFATTGDSGNSPITFGEQPGADKLSLNDSITLRRRLAAPLIRGGGTTDPKVLVPDPKRPGKGKIYDVANVFIAALLHRIILLASERTVPGSVTETSAADPTREDSVPTPVSRSEHFPPSAVRLGTDPLPAYWIQVRKRDLLEAAGSVGRVESNNPSAVLYWKTLPSLLLLAERLFGDRKVAKYETLRDLETMLELSDEALRVCDDFKYLMLSMPTGKIVEALESCPPFLEDPDRWLKGFRLRQLAKTLSEKRMKRDELVQKLRMIKDWQSRWYSLSLAPPLHRHFGHREAFEEKWAQTQEQLAALDARLGRMERESLLDLPIRDLIVVLTEAIERG